jgi:hypothetical protein
VRSPAYPLDNFVKACGLGNAVVHGNAQKTARDEFALASQAAILAFIGNGGLEKPVFANRALWENNPNPQTPIDVDSYDFHSGTKHGYIAFMFQPVTGLWLIKSLKANSDPSPLNFPFANIHQLVGKGDKK